MIAITSQRPNAPEDIALNQRLALESFEREFAGTVLFVTPKEPPTIRELCLRCAEEKGWSSIVNADIVIGRNWSSVELELNRSKVDCAISKRWELPPDRNQDNAEVVDLGLDFFAAKPHVWAAAAKEVPEVFRLGKIVWDTWMLGFFMHISRGNCADITPARCIFHPKHGDRRDQHIEVPHLKHRPLWPGFKIGVGWPKQMKPLRPLPMVEGGGGGASLA